MSLDSCLSIASSGIRTVNAELALVSQNVANAGTAGYVTESSAQTSVTAAGQGMGVRTMPATLDLNGPLQASLFAQNATVANLQTQQTALQQIDGVIGTPGAGNDLVSRLGALQDGFTTLLADPTNATQQQQVVTDAGNLTQQINTVASAVQSGRQTAQDNIVSQVASLNQQLGTIGQLNTQIIGLSSQGQSTAALQNSRNTAMAAISNLVNVQFVTQSSGSMTVMTAGGSILPTDGSLTLQASEATMSAASGTPPPITLGGQDITSSLTGGTLGANIALRDTILPTSQAELDEFSQSLANRFSSQGLTLFSDASGNVPASGGSPVQAAYLGFAGTIQVNPQVTANPSLVRDGSTAIAGAPTGASAFTPNNATGPAGFTTLINRVLTYAFGSQAQTGVAQPTANTSGLGASGTLSAPYGGTGTLSNFAADVTGAQAQQSANVTNSLTTESGVQSSLQQQLTSVSGVNMDTQLSTMISLQNAYAANARVIAAVQAMFSTLVAAIT